MSPLSLLLNVLWIVFGGLWMAAGWMIAAVIMAITIIGLPWARAAFNIGVYSLLPFGQQAINRDQITGQHDFGTGPFGLIGNLIWLVLASWWLALGHLITAVTTCPSASHQPASTSQIRLPIRPKSPVPKSD